MADQAASPAHGRDRAVSRAAQIPPRPDQPSRARRFFTEHARVILGVVGIVILLVLWETGARTGVINRVIMSAPTSVLTALLNEIERGRIWGHLFASLMLYTLGFTLAVVVGVAVGVIAGWWRVANYMVDPWVTVLYSTPIVVFVPMIILLLGIDLWAKVFIVFLISVFTVIVNTMAGVTSTSAKLVDVARSFGANQRRQLTEVVLPGALPNILTGIRLAGGNAMVGVIVAELVAGNQGIGFLLNLAGANLQSGTVMALILMIGLWGIGFAEVMRRVEHHFEVWRVQ
jgi:ABC-type nitrate/sulfonate/bicarbonate transport system permease component